LLVIPTAAHQQFLAVNIIDAANIEPNLCLSAQLIEMKVPVIVVFNRIDLAENRIKK